MEYKNQFLKEENRSNIKKENREERDKVNGNTEKEESIEKGNQEGKLKLIQRRKLELGIKEEK